MIDEKNPAATDSAEIKDLLLGMTADIVSAYVSNNTIRQDELPAVIEQVFTKFKSISSSETEAKIELKPAVPIKKSFTDDYLICLEDGKKLKMLKRYLRTRYGLSPEDYRAKWGLPSDYPMVAPSYASRRSEFAKSIGLGKKSKKKSKK